MFDINDKKYLTKRIFEEIPFELIACLYELIGHFRNIAKLDYLQVYNITSKKVKGSGLYEIYHFQEEPFISENVCVLLPSYVELLDNKIYIIDENIEEETGCNDTFNYSTVLFASEY